MDKIAADAAKDRVKWINVRERVPQRGARVLVNLLSGRRQEAVFVVDRLEDWPAGASWSVDTLNYNLPFYAVESWKPLSKRAANQNASPTQTAPAASRDGSKLPAICVEITQEAALTRLAFKALTNDLLKMDGGSSAQNIRQLSAEVVALVGRMATILESDALDAADEPPTPLPQSCAELGRRFTRHWSRVAKSAATTDASALRATWTLKRGGIPVFERPRGDVLRRLALSPLVHYRGQLIQSMQMAGAEVSSFYAPWELPAITPPQPDATALQ